MRERLCRTSSYQSRYPQPGPAFRTAQASTKADSNQHVPPMTGSIKVFVSTLALLVTLVANITFADDAAGTEKKGEPIAEKTIETTLHQHTDRLMSLPGVVGTAIGECEGKPCIQVLVVRKTPDLSRSIPHTLEGFPVVVVETGEIRALDPD